MNDLLQTLCETAASFYSRGLAFGSTGNLSVRVEGDIYVTPTGSSLKNLVPADLACVSIEDGSKVNTNVPSKETPFHLACYRAHPQAQALVHLHSTYAVALSCLENFDPEQPIRTFTPYYRMRVEPLGLVPYFRPGSQALADAMGQCAATHTAILMLNHGATTLGRKLEEAVDRYEELEETAKLYFLLRSEKLRYLSQQEVDELDSAFRSHG